MIMAAAAVWPLGLWTPVPLRKLEQAKNTYFSTAMEPSTPTTATAHAAHPRHHPDKANARPTTAANGSITAWSAKSVRNCTG